MYIPEGFQCRIFRSKTHSSWARTFGGCEIFSACRSCEMAVRRDPWGEGRWMFGGPSLPEPLHGLRTMGYFRSGRNKSAEAGIVGTCGADEGPSGEAGLRSGITFLHHAPLSSHIPAMSSAWLCMQVE